MTVGERWRLFVAIDLGSAARQALRRAQDAARRVGLAARWVDPAGAHLTLKFLGGTDRALVDPLGAALRASVARRPPFSLHTGGLGAFPNGRRPRVIWLGLTGAIDELTALQREVDSALVALGIPAETRPFSPHLTLGRVRDEDRSPGPELFTAARAAVGSVGAPLPVANVRLIRSELGHGGGRYMTLCEVPLAGAGAIA